MCAAVPLCKITFSVQLTQTVRHHSRALIHVAQTFVLETHVKKVSFAKQLTFYLYARWLVYARTEVVSRLIVDAEHRQKQNVLPTPTVPIVKPAAEVVASKHAELIHVDITHCVTL